MKQVFWAWYIFLGLVQVALIIPVSTHAAVRTLIINQIRGSEACCHPGTADMMSKINSDSEKSQLSLAWALRFDVLTDATFLEQVKTLPAKQALGLLLEVTPQWASASGVLYKGETSGFDWYIARNAFLIGYNLDERKKLLETLFDQFKNEFGYYPSFTSGWLIDAWSLRYVQETYGVELHEITKEQYETDSYTLYGGIFNAAYYPSLLHPLLPAESAANQLDLVIVRQTISDIGKNYGSALTYFTSQPNDYLQNPAVDRSNYFNHLLLQLVDQGKGVAVVGLENSAEWSTYKAEYQKQLSLLVEKQKEGTFEILSPHEFAVAFRNDNLVNAPVFLKSSGFPEAENSVLWYFGRSYRARIQIVDGAARLTDLRIYAPITDPYQAVPATTSRAYWIVPYAFDGSQQYTTRTTDKSKTDTYAGHPVRSDENVTPFGIRLTAAKIDRVTVNQPVVTLEGNGVQVTLAPDSITTSEPLSGFGEPVGTTFNQILTDNSEQFVSFTRHPRFFIKPENATIYIGWETPQLDQVKMAAIVKAGTLWQILPQTLTETQVAQLAVILQPDRATLPFDPAASTFYWPNTEAIAGRNPVRLYLVALSSLSRPVVVKSLTTHLDEQSGIVSHVPTQLETKLEPFFIDFTATQSGTSTVSLAINGTIIATDTTLRFYTDCQKEVLVCLSHPEELKGFFTFLIKEKIAHYTQKLAELAQKTKTETEAAINKYLGKKI